MTRVDPPRPWIVSYSEARQTRLVVERHPLRVVAATPDEATAREIVAVAAAAADGARLLATLRRVHEALELARGRGSFELDEVGGLVTRIGAVIAGAPPPGGSGP
jgi:hypothetical protein